MKALIVLVFIVLSVSSFSQTTTYSKEEGMMIHYVNNARAYAEKYNSVQDFKSILDSCWRFLKRYPRSFAKPNVLSYMLEMTSVITKDMNKINPLIDSVLSYDKLPVTKQSIGEILIKRDLDIPQGRKLIIDALPDITVTIHKYKSYMMLAKSDVALGNNASAKVNYENAIRLDSTRADAWFEYFSYLKMRELHAEAEAVKNKILKMQMEAKLHYVNDSRIGPNVNKSILGIEFKDLDGRPVSLNKFAGKAAVINHWSFWCGLCVYEFPTLKRLIKEFPDVEFIFVNGNDKQTELRERYFKKKEFAFLAKQTVLYDEKSVYDHTFGSDVPHTMVIDKAGNVRFEYSGFKPELETALRDNLRRLVKE